MDDLLSTSTIKKSRVHGISKLVAVAVEYGLISNKELLDEIKKLHYLRNKIVHEGISKLNEADIKKYLDIGHELIGIVPYKEDTSESIETLGNYAFGSIRFEQEVKEYFRKKYAKTHEIRLNPQKGPKYFRSDLLLIDRNRNCTIAEIKLGLPISQFQIDTVRSMIKYYEEYDFKSVNIWLVVPEHTVASQKQLKIKYYDGIHAKMYKKGKLIDLGPKTSLSGKALESWSRQLEQQLVTHFRYSVRNEGNENPVFHVNDIYTPTNRGGFGITGVTGPDLFATLQEYANRTGIISLNELGEFQLTDNGRRRMRELDPQID